MESFSISIIIDLFPILISEASAQSEYDSWTCAAIPAAVSVTQVYDYICLSENDFIELI